MLNLGLYRDVFIKYQDNTATRFSRTKAQEDYIVSELTDKGAPNVVFPKGHYSIAECHKMIQEALNSKDKQVIVLNPILK